MAGSPCLQIPITRTEEEARVELNRPALVPTELVIEDCKFWMVWTKTGHPPRRTHAMQSSAEDEADRLARKFPGRKFIVLRGERKCHVPSPAEPTGDQT